MPSSASSPSNNAACQSLLLTPWAQTLIDQAIEMIAPDRKAYASSVPPHLLLQAQGMKRPPTLAQSLSCLVRAHIVHGCPRPRIITVAPSQPLLIKEISTTGAAVPPKATEMQVRDASSVPHPHIRSYSYRYEPVLERLTLPPTTPNDNLWQLLNQCIR